MLFFLSKQCNDKKNQLNSHKKTGQEVIIIHNVVITLVGF